MDEELRTKTLQLEDFIEKNNHLSIQGSKDWLNERRFSIGGSEIATIIGKNKYSSIENLVAQKISISSFEGNTATRWGNLFENMTELIFKSLFLKNNKIYTTGSIPHKNIKYHKYSPDGLCVIKIADKYKIILLEFKAPLCSVPENVIPAHYLPQIKAGLSTLELTEQGIFMNNMFRKCTLNDLNFTNRYDTSFHNDGKKNIEIKDALANGIIMFYISSTNIHTYLSLLLEENDASIDADENNYEDEDENNFSSHMANDKFKYIDFMASDCETCDEDDNFDKKINEPELSLLNKLYKNVALFMENNMDYKKYDIIDLGGSSPDDMEEWLKLYKNDVFLETKYIKPNFNINAILNDKNLYISPELSYIKDKSYLDNICHKYNFKKTIDKYKQNFIKNGLIPVAVLPWKLIKSDIILVNKEEEYLDKYAEIIENTINIIKNITISASNKDELALEFDKTYPKNKITAEYRNSKPLSKEEIYEIIN